MPQNAKQGASGIADLKYDLFEYFINVGLSILVVFGTAVNFLIIGSISGSLKLLVFV